MTDQKQTYLLAERSAVERLLEETPADDVLERSGLEARLEELRDQLASANRSVEGEESSAANFGRCQRPPA